MNEPIEVPNSGRIEPIQPLPVPVAPSPQPAKKSRLGLIVALVVVSTVLVVGAVFGQTMIRPSTAKVVSRLVANIEQAKSFDYSGTMEYEMTSFLPDDISFTQPEGDTQPDVEPGRPSSDGSGFGGLWGTGGNVKGAVTGKSELAALLRPGQVLGSQAYKFSLEVSGSVDERDENKPLSEIRIKATGEGLVFSMDIRRVGSNGYIKINEFPLAFASGLRDYIGKWIYLDGKYLSEQLGYDQEEASALDAERLDKIKQLVLKMDFLTLGKREAVETIGQDKAGKYRYEIDKAKLVSMLSELYRILEPEEKQAVTDMTLEGLEKASETVVYEPGYVWLGSRDSLPRRLQFGMSGDSRRSSEPASTRLGSETDYKLKADFTFSNYGRPAPVVAPEGDRINIKDVVSAALGLDPGVGSGLLEEDLGVAEELARLKGRDAVRLADISSIKIFMELYHIDNGAYPDQVSPYADPSPKSFGPTGSASTEWQDRDPVWPTMPKAPVGPCAQWPYDDYVYHGVTAAGASDTSDPPSYEISFCLEQSVGGFGAGIRKATPNGIK